MTTREHLISCIGEEAVEIAVELIEVAIGTALEVSKVASKTNRFGLQDRNVLIPDGPTNIERLIGEINDLVAVTDMLANLGVIEKHWLNPELCEAKKLKVLKFINYAKSKGAIVDE